ncbi:hypothetical protein BOQ62_01510 [Chryseobacterium sp. CH21]|uniref:hypothetical protein n=1 Tax=Chryseobacterium sp. CH21 TaxID=713556 RepID=UPI00100B8486|nr:hypothetical protein [Chryseobacterium sp. CH21]RXM41306.1 hypothetical protein BOQ62_01510 [Chryseobacterium sp. CH21]
MKKDILKVFIINIMILSLIAYILGLTDSAFTQVYPSENMFFYLVNSIQYFILWVLPYWWLIIMGGAVLLTLLYYILRKIKL